MSTTKRRIDPGVAQRLLQQPQRFGFFQAMRVLERLFARQGERLPDVLPRHLRFSNSLSLAFPPSEIEAMSAYTRAGELLDRPAAIEHALLTEDLASVHVTPAFMGLLGAAGVLPMHYTELFAQREVYDRDRTGRGFMDIFLNRAVALHYGAWKKYRLGIQYEQDKRARFLPLLLSLAGLGLGSLRERMVDGEADVFDQAVAHYAGVVRQHPVSATVLQRVLSDYFRVQVRVEQFVSAWYDIPDDARTRLGVGSARLGASAVVGGRVWQRDLRMRLWVGPLGKGQFDDFLPGGRAAKALAKWLTLLTGVSLEYEVRLVLKAEDVPCASLGKAGAARLGWDSYMGRDPGMRPRSDTRYTIHTLH